MLIRAQKAGGDIGTRIGVTEASANEFMADFKEWFGMSIEEYEEAHRRRYRELQESFCMRGENPDEVTPQKVREFLQLMYDLIQPYKPL